MVLSTALQLSVQDSKRAGGDPGSTNNVATQSGGGKNIIHQMKLNVTESVAPLAGATQYVFVQAGGNVTLSFPSQDCSIAVSKC